ncbi:hypothetical protein ACIRD8_16980 [Streptomyces sp. NPDC102451]|uniref:hypothetical protein n=1 Tax=Streptomyces sp. NPDC102451 TaxID=3366177 RepID=UPI003802C87A
MTVRTLPGGQTLEAVHRAARDEGLAPALTALCGTVAADRLPRGPGGHGLYAATTELPAGVTEVGSAGLPGGPVVMVRHDGGGGAGHQDAAFGLGLVWLRLGLSEWLREEVVAYLQGRTVGDGNPLLQQQLLRSAVAEALLEHLEVRAVVEGAAPGELSGAALDDLQERLTVADRSQVRMLGASGYLSTGPGQVAYVSELLAEAYPAG